MNPSPDHEENLKRAERIAYLIAGHLRGTLLPAEQDELDDWITDSDENLELFETLTDEDNIEAAMQRYGAIEQGKAAALAGVKESLGLPAEKRPVRRLKLYLVAASLIVAAAGFYLFTRPTQQPIEKPIAQAPADVPAGSDKAVLTLSDGRTLILDSTGTGELASEGAVQIKQQAGRLVYDGAAGHTRYNVVSTPRGGRYGVVLSDGTRVWLNAESSLRYPAAFTGTSRPVVLRGEGYFEVAKNASSPFIVTLPGADGDTSRVKVLGTHFNINSYGDEGSVTATLLEGSVAVQKGNSTRLLKPGEQARIATGINVAAVNAAEAIAWKEGTFLFRDAGIRAVGEQIKRWYDVDVVYEGTITQHFNTVVPRAVPLARLLEGLEGTGQVHFVLTGKKLVIKP